ncbi:putative transcription factor C2H2 family [Rosa chinensis]|uniref:RING-type E3 ubiquitin transferase n=1 Tax=Rosa chinensis TaxID=74649 RepID=A0A2P6P695_ROSCH|nr:putative transcription factor C2H2 family [Rosa chinensis]
MATIITLLLLFFSFFFFFLPHIAATTCGASACAASGPSVRFPFRLTDRQQTGCGYSGKFGVSCNGHKQTILNLPSSGNFTVESISYKDQLVWINDLDNCIFKRFLDKDFSLIGSPFQYALDLQEYTFYKCSPQLVPLWSPISCLSSDNSEVIGVASWSTLSRSPSPYCDVITRALVPAKSYELGNSDFGVGLTWKEPDCRSCEASGKVCGFQNGSQSKIHCSSTLSYGLSKATKYGIAIGVLIPGLLSITCCALYVSAPRRDHGRIQESTTELSGTVTNRQPQVFIAGLDGQTIESYPKTQLSERLELPDPNDKTCPICLGEYQPKETLRTIPECNHYFHANYIDEWLRKNPTCPLCRNLPGLCRNPLEVSSVRPRDDYAIY